jgi:hypothetical protein
MRGDQPAYCSFFIRFWHEKGAREQTLRIIVVDTQTGEKGGFDSIEGLFRSLKQRIDHYETQHQGKEEMTDENE